MARRGARRVGRVGLSQCVSAGWNRGSIRCPPSVLNCSRDYRMCDSFIHRFYQRSLKRPRYSARRKTGLHTKHRIMKSDSKMYLRHYYFQSKATPWIWRLRPTVGHFRGTGSCSALDGLCYLLQAVAACSASAGEKTEGLADTDIIRFHIPIQREFGYIRFGFHTRNGFV